MGRFKSAAEGDTPTVVQAEQVAASTMDKTGAKYLRAPECILGRVKGLARLLGSARPSFANSFRRKYAFIPPEGQAFGSHVFCSQSRTVLLTIFPTSTLHMLVYSPTHNYRTSFSSLLDQLAKRTQRIILWFSVQYVFTLTLQSTVIITLTITIELVL